ncbi:MAG: SDR family oxidoreductase [Deltaproteobacteria bacterium]|jgi:nucleoside-diphosphate-sugar epimerase|nr:SDR family oxidoreductase [Deltaproteobacteria bacterium]
MTQKNTRNPIKNHSVLIVGGAGYIGSVLTGLLLESGCQVAVFDDFIHGPEPLLALKKFPSIEIVEGDIRDIKLVEKSVKGRRSVILLAALVGEAACNLDPQQTMEINYLAPLNLFEAAKINGVSRFIFTSTDSCYGAREGEKLTELSPLKPLSLYAQLKAKLEEEFLSRKATVGFTTTILRLATVYGLSPRIRFDLAVNLLVREVVLKGRATIFSGEQWRPLVHVKDVANAFKMVLEAPAELVDSEIFNVGSDDQNIQFKELAELLPTLSEEAKIDIVPADPDLRDYYVAFEKIERVLGFKAKIKLLDGMKEIKQSLLAGFPPDPYDEKWRNTP